MRIHSRFGSINRVQMVHIRNIRVFVSYSAMIDSGMPLVLPVGDYQVVASSYDQAAAEGRVSETPYFEGKQDFVIEEKTVTSVPSFTCTFESVGVEVRFV